MTVSICRGMVSTHQSEPEEDGINYIYLPAELSLASCERFIRFLAVLVYICLW